MKIERCWKCGHKSRLSYEPVRAINGMTPGFYVQCSYCDNRNISFYHDEGLIMLDVERAINNWNSKAHDIKAYKRAAVEDARFIVKHGK